jgi:prolipoprotein diacylglyceryltransferase
LAAKCKCQKRHMYRQKRPMYTQKRPANPPLVSNSVFEVALFSLLLYSSEPTRGTRPEGFFIFIFLASFCILRILLETRRSLPRVAILTLCVANVFLMCC